MNNEENEYILSSKILAHFGYVSYCFYLFHYVIIYIFVEYLENYKKILICFIFTYITSFAFTKLYENPIRKNITQINYQIIFSSVLHISFLIILLYFFRINRKEILVQKNKKLLYNYNDIKKAWQDIRSNVLNCPSKNAIIFEFKEVLFALLIVDSHVQQWFKIIIPYLISNNYVPLQIYSREFNVIVKDLSAINKIIILFKHIEIVIIGYYLESDISHIRIRYFKNYINLLLKHTDLLYIVQDTPHFSTNPNECLNTKRNFYQCYGILGVNASVFKLPYVNDNRIKYIDMNRYICNSLKYCYFVIDNYPVYRDNHHLTIQFATKLKKEFLNQFIVNKIRNTINIHSELYKCYLDKMKFI